MGGLGGLCGVSDGKGSGEGVVCFMFLFTAVAIIYGHIVDLITW